MLTPHLRSLITTGLVTWLCSVNPLLNYALLQYRLWFTAVVVYIYVYNISVYCVSNFEYYHWNMIGYLAIWLLFLLVVLTIAEVFKHKIDIILSGSVKLLFSWEKWTPDFIYKKRWKQGLDFYLLHVIWISVLTMKCRLLNLSFSKAILLNS